MARLGDLVVRTARFLDAVAGAYAMFSYGMAVPGVFLLAWAGLYYFVPGASPEVEALVSVAAAFAGVVLGYLLSSIVPRRAAVYAASIQGERSPLGRAWFWALFAGGYFVGSYLGVLLLDGCGNIWYLGLLWALALVTLYLSIKYRRGCGWRCKKTAEAFLVSLVVGVALAPLALCTCSVLAGLGSLMLSYLAGGSWAIWEASRVFEASKAR
ncbi:MAG: hypothetical protein LRS46_01895 [Desulfurococcales archaeon]|nr:hypothetical protein [Desulfurococcales archaeon]